MKIVQVNSTFTEGAGIDRVMFGIIRWLKEDFDVKVLVAESGYESVYEDMSNLEVEVIKTGAKQYPVLKMLNTVRNRVMRDKDSIYHLHHAVLNWCMLGVKNSNYLCTFHGWNPMKLDRGFFLKKYAREVFLRSTRRLYPKMNCVTAVSKVQKSDLEAIGTKNVIHVPNGVDTRQFTVTGKDDNYMLFVGRHIGQKRIDQLIRISAEENIPLHVVGSGPLKDELHALKKKLDAPVTFLENISEEELIMEYQRCTFYATASGWEGMTLTIPEAAACAKPAVAYNIPSNRENMVQLETGILCHDPEDFRRSILKMYHDDDLRKTLGEAARKRMETQFDWKIIANQYVDIYKNLMEKTKNKGG